MSFPDFQQLPTFIEQLPFPVFKFGVSCLKLVIADEKWKKCTLAALSTLPGGATGALTAALFTWNITVCAVTGALISSIALIALRIFLEPILEKSKPVINAIESVIQSSQNATVKSILKHPEVVKLVTATVHNEMDAFLKSQKANAEKYKDATIESLIPDANSGDVKSQLKIALMFKDKDPEQSIKYFIMAKDNNTATDRQKGEANYYLGLLCKDDKQIEYMIHASTYGYNLATLWICDQYKKKYEVTSSTELKIDYLTIVADKENAKAQLELGSLYANEDAPNYRLAIKYLVEPAIRGDQAATDLLCKIHDEKGIKDDNHFYLLIARDKNLPQAQYERGSHLYEDLQKAAKPDYTIAIQLIEAAANKNHVDAQLLLGKMYEDGLVNGEKNSSVKAGEWYTKAARSKKPEALFQLARFYATNPKTYGNALKLYAAAINTGSIPALVALGEMHEQGLGTEKNEKKALDYYRQAMEKGNENGKAAYERIQPKSCETPLNNQEMPQQIIIEVGGGS